jgi:threonine-phosphate decarboxylase
VTPQHILIHGGSAALFDVILRAYAPRRLGLCIPAFAEYARAAAANGIEVRTFALDVDSGVAFESARFCQWVRHAGIEAVVLTNPHNPLGFALPAALLRDIRARLPAITFIVDEAFADYDEAVSVARDATADPQLIVVRSVTKFYAMPDLRVGYAVMTAERAQSMSRFVPAWPVSGIAAAAAAAAVSDDDYGNRTRSSNLRDRAELRAGLTTLDLRVLPSSTNFVTFEWDGVAALHERLLARRIIVRDCSSFAGLAPDRYVRVAVRTTNDNARLLRALAAAR